MLMFMAIALSLLGLVALIPALRGRRIDDHLICRKCRFDLIGVWPAPSPSLAGTDADARCPECGAELAQPRAVRTGARRRRPLLLTAAVVTLLAGLAWTGGLGWGRATSFNWNTVKPTWLLMLETRGPAHGNADAGMQELTVRLGAGGLSAEQIDAIADNILEAQGDPNAPWHTSWGSFIETAHALGRLRPEFLERYARQAFTPAFTVGELRYLNGSLTYPLRYDQPRAADGRSLWVRPRLLEMRVGDREVDAGPNCGNYAIRSGGLKVVTPRVDAVLPAGEHEVTLRINFNLFDGMSKFEDPPLASWPGELTTSVTVDPNAGITWNDDPELHPVFERGHPQTPTVRTTEAGPRVDGFMHFERVPVGTVADVFFRDGEREWKVGRIQLSPGGSVGIGMTLSDPLPGFTAREVDVILRTVEDEEPDASWPDEVWRGEHVIPDVPLRWTR